MKKQINKFILFILVLFFLDSCKTFESVKKNNISSFILNNSNIVSLNFKKIKGEVKKEFMQEARNFNPDIDRLFKRLDYIFVSFNKNSDPDILLLGNIPSFAIDIIAKKENWKKYKNISENGIVYNDIWEISNGLKITLLEPKVFAISKNIENFLKNYSRKYDNIDFDYHNIKDGLEKEFLYLNYKNTSINNPLFKDFKEKFNVGDRLKIRFDLRYTNTPLKDSKNKTIFNENIVLTLKNKNLARVFYKLISLSLKFISKDVKVDLVDKKIFIRNFAFLKGYKDIFSFVPFKF